jgi:hypothetical protein
MSRYGLEIEQEALVEELAGGADIKIKICSRCGLEKEEGCFSKNKNSCKVCDKIIYKEWYDKNKDKILERKKIYKTGNIEEIQKYKNNNLSDLKKLELEGKKKCKECGLIDDANLFSKESNWCKKCENKYRKIRREKGKALTEKIKKCIKCNFEGKSIFFETIRNVCKKCKTKERKEYLNKSIEHDNNFPYEIKKCTKCGLEKETIFFEKGQRICKDCKKQYRKKRNKITKEYHREYYKKNKEKIKKREKLYRDKNKDIIKKRQKKYEEGNREKITERKNIYRKNNKERLNSKTRIRERFKRKTDVNWKLSKILRGRLNDAIKNSYRYTHCSAVNNLGYSIEELKLYLENLFKPGMSWNNWGKVNKDENGYFWEIDHIISFNSVDLTNEEELLKVCNYKNLRPCWRWANMARNTYKDNEIDFNSPVPKYFIKEEEYSNEK